MSVYHVQSRPTGGLWQTREDCFTYVEAAQRAGELAILAPISHEWRVRSAADESLPLVPLDDQTTRELSRAAKNVSTWTEKRNTLIRAAHAAGGGIREIARATGLNVATVHNIIKPRARRG